MSDWVTDIQRAQESVEFGDVFLHLKKFQGDVVALVNHEQFTSHKFKDNAEAASFILSLIRDQIAGNELTGSKTITLNFKNGVVGNITEQGEKKQHYGGKK